MERKYSDLMLKNWSNEIKYAEKLVNGEIVTSGTDNGYVINLDPEDFLDLCAGKWPDSCHILSH